MRGAPVQARKSQGAAGGWHKAQAGELNFSSSSFSVPSSPPGEGEVCRGGLQLPCREVLQPHLRASSSTCLVNLHREERAGRSSGAVNRAGASCPAAARGTRPRGTGAEGRAPVGAGGVPTSPRFLQCTSHSTNPQPLSRGGCVAPGSVSPWPSQGSKPRKCQQGRVSGQFREWKCRAGSIWSLPERQQQPQGHYREQVSLGYQPENNLENFQETGWK